MKFFHSAVSCVCLVATLIGCQAEEVAVPPPKEVAVNTEDLQGDVTPEEILALPEWKSAMADVVISEDRAHRKLLAEADEIVVVLGTWCPDSVRELTQFWGWAGGTALEGVKIRYVAGDTHKDIGDANIGALKPIAYPTFFVFREGKLQGSVVEHAVDGIGTDLTRLLTGEVDGMISSTR